MDLCEACTCFAKAISQNAGNDDWRFNNTTEILRQQHKCSFCTWLLSSSWKKHYSTVYITLHSILWGDEGPLDADGYDVLYAYAYQNHECHFSAQAPEGTYVLKVLISAKEGSAAAACGWPLASNLLPPKVGCGETYFAFAQAWFATCFREHVGCRSTIAEGPIDETVGPELPTRVLEIKAGRCQMPVVKLVEPQKRHGFYFALSHRWGSPDKQPLRTTKDNFQSHLQGISLESLPRTFQDAIEFTSSLNGQYLWIDSLCIIQDDEQDWKKEASEMGRIFENASLTIGAGAAEDSSEGLYSPIRHRQARISIPYSTGDDQIHTSFEERLLVEELSNCAPALGSLSRRGWVFQEQHLSRRQVSFTKGGMSWKCREQYMDQFGHRSSASEDTDWCLILLEYTLCELTRASDRLIALEGLVQRRKKTWQDDYSFGVWHARITEHILWFRSQLGQPSGDLPNLPSWSWAATSGQKAFWAHHAGYDGVCTHRHNMITITDSGLMKLRQAPMIPCRTINRPISHHVKVGLQLANSYFFDEVEDSTLANIHTLQRNVSLPVGIAALDREGELCRPTYCISLERWQNIRDWLYAKDMYESDDTEEESSVRHESEPFLGLEEELEKMVLQESERLSENLERQVKSSRKSVGISDASCSKNETQGSGPVDKPRNKMTHSSKLEEVDTCWHIVLLLEPEPARLNHYRRVGMGIIPEIYWNRANVTYQDVNLV